MHGSKTDKRSVRTRLAIESSLLKLLNDFPLEKISIKQLCAEADINRTTFYLHYTDVEDVMKTIREQYVSHILTRYRVLRAPLKADVYTGFLRAVNDETLNTPGLEQFIMQSKEAGKFIQDLKASFYEKIYAMRTYDAAEGKKEHCGYVTVFLCSGVIDSYIVWLKEGKITPFEVLCESFGAIIKAGHSCFMAKATGEKKE